MTPRVVFLPQARDDLRKGKRWYDAQVKGLGREFAMAVDTAVEAIGARPKAFTEVYGEFRQCVMRRFPYTIFFRLQGAQVVVVAVHHERRDPATWQGRTT